MTETAARLRRTPSDWLSASLQPATLLGLMMIVACWIGFAFVVSLERGKSLDAAINQSAHLVRLFEENTIRTLQSIDRTLSLLRKAFEDDPKHFNLAHWTERTALIGDLTIQLSMIGSDGFMTASTTGYGGPPIYLGDREHFRAQIDAKTDELFISKPVLGRASGM